MKPKKLNGFQRYLARLTPKGRARALAKIAAGERWDRYRRSWLRKNHKKAWGYTPDGKRAMPIELQGMLRALWQYRGEPRYAI